jgi:hypothetical protein
MSNIKQCPQIIKPFAEKFYKLSSEAQNIILMHGDNILNGYQELLFELENIRMVESGLPRYHAVNEVIRFYIINLSDYIK